MTNNKLVFLKKAFAEFEIQFSEDNMEATIVNPNYNEHIDVYDEEYQFTVCFSYQHRHFDTEEELAQWIREVINGDTFAIEFFSGEKRYCGSDIDGELLRSLSYEKLEQFTGYYGGTKLIDLSDSCKVRSWDGKNNFDFVFRKEADGTVTLLKTFVGIA